jgi:hypothetical protein
MCGAQGNIERDYVILGGHFSQIASREPKWGRKEAKRQRGLLGVARLAPSGPSRGRGVNIGCANWSNRLVVCQGFCVLLESTDCAFMYLTHSSSVHQQRVWSRRPCAAERLKGPPNSTYKADQKSDLYRDPDTH